MPATFTEHGNWYDAYLCSVSDSAQILYSYDTVAHGFSARLTPAEAQAMESLAGVLSVLPEVRYEHHVTRTPEFLLDKSNGLVPQANTASDVVVGVLDTGVWQERKKHRRHGLRPRAGRVEGRMQGGEGLQGDVLQPETDRGAVLLQGL
ncbi:putative Subtilisin-like protease SBT1.7 [Cocos nucifera]|uniref:Putative Subtilisin-like protease SBT1.7 n=1 Tax=Cocos nucifera TaxID=13894 RepID=A0A8K0MXW0_COCNU|nr:putative Subtilisin-like protease SBT1.7 [Cocos nucifera]